MRFLARESSRNSGSFRSSSFRARSVIAIPQPIGQQKRVAVLLTLWRAHSAKRKGMASSILSRRDPPAPGPGARGPLPAEAREGPGGGGEAHRHGPGGRGRRKVEGAALRAVMSVVLGVGEAAREVVVLED